MAFDATYGADVYREQGGDALVCGSSGSIEYPVQTLTSTQTGTDAYHTGLTILTGTTTGPTYSLAPPLRAGVIKTFSLTSSSSGVTHRAVLQSNSTAVSFDTTGGNQITFATSALKGITLQAASTASWRIIGTYSGASLGTPRTT